MACNRTAAPTTRSRTRGSTHCPTSCRRSSLRSRVSSRSILPLASGTGLIGTALVADSVERFRTGGGEGKPTYGQLHVCWAKSEEEGRRTALEWWPNATVSGSHFLELPLPAHFEEATELVREEDVAESVVCGPDSERHLAAIRDYVDAGYDHVYVHQVGPDQEGFFDFYKREILPELA